MGDKKMEHLVRDRFAIEVAGWRLAKMLAAHHRDEAGTSEIRIEDQRFCPWDDLTELRTDGWHGWQVKRARDELPGKDVAALLTKLRDDRMLTAGHLAVQHPVFVPRDGGRRLGLGVLRDLSEQVRRCAEGSVRRTATQEGDRWLRWIAEILSVEPDRGEQLLLRLHVRFVGTEDDVRRAREGVVARFADDPKPVDAILMRCVEESLHPGVRFLPQGLLDRLEAKGARLRPSRESLRRTRADYLRSLALWHADRRPLHDLLRDAGTIPPGLRMTEVEMPIRLRPTARAGGRVPPPQDAPAWTLQELLTPAALQRRSEVHVFGEMGTGKTTLLEQAAAQLGKQAEVDLTAPLPLLITAAEVVDPDAPLTGRFSGAHPQKTLRSAADTRWIYLIDGYDEVPNGDRVAVDAGLQRLRRDDRTAALALASRPSRPPRRREAEAYEICAWTRSERDRFATTWTQLSASNGAVHNDEELREELFGNPLTATLYLAFWNRDRTKGASRAHLFALLVEHLFDQWARARGVTTLWGQAAPKYQQLARRMLATGATSVSRPEIESALAESAPNSIVASLSAASEQLGLLIRTESGFGFALRPIAEHLAGAALAEDELDAVSLAATELWAEEPVRHCVGLLVFRGQGSRAREILNALAWTPPHETVAGHALRTGSIAARAAADIRLAHGELADHIADSLLLHLVDGSSNWRPVRAQRLVHDLIARGGEFASTLRDRVAALRSSDAEQRALAKHRDAPSRLYHREPAVRIAAVQQLRGAVDQLATRWLLARLLWDGGTLDPARWSVAVEAGLVLRLATRDTAFEPMRDHLSQLVGARSQLASGAAAVALAPEELHSAVRQRALSELATGYQLPRELVDEVEQLTQATIESPSRGAGWSIRAPTEAEIAESAAALEERPSRFIRSCISRALGSSALDLSPDAIADCAARARMGDVYELEVLCERAGHDPVPLIDVLRSVTPNPEAPHLLDRDRGFLNFSDMAAEWLGHAARRHDQVVKEICQLWLRFRNARRPLIGFPGRVLEEGVAAREPKATEVYVEWLGQSFGGPQPQPEIPVQLRRINSVVRAAEKVLATAMARAFEARDDDGPARLAPQVLGRVMSALRPFWIDNETIIEQLSSWFHADDDEKVLAAVRAFGRDGWPREIENAIVLRVERDVGSDAVLELASQIALMVGIAGTAIAPRCIDRLKIVSRTDSPLRFAAAAAVITELPDDDAWELSTELANSWPPDNWAFYYARHDSVRDRLVEAAPAAWARRCSELHPSWGVGLAGIVTKHLPSAEKPDLLQGVLCRALRESLPWVMVEGPHLSRVLDDALELIYDAGIGATMLQEWLATPEPNREGSPE